jgi:hypothetical protein
MKKKKQIKQWSPDGGVVKQGPPMRTFSPAHSEMRKTRTMEGREAEAFTR